MTRTLALLFLVLLFHIASGSYCKDNLFAKKTAEEVALDASNTLRTSDSTTLTLAQIKALFQYLWKPMMKWGTGFQGDVGIGWANTNYFHVKFCLGGLANTAPCVAAANLGYYWVGTAVHPTLNGLNRYYFALDSKGQVVDKAGSPQGELYFETGTPYNCTTRPWWIPTTSENPAWSPEYPWVTGVNGSSLVYPFPGKETTGKIVIDILNEQDPCYSLDCLANSIALAEAEYLATDTSLATATRTQMWAKMMATIKRYAVTRHTNLYFTTPAVGTATKFYMVQNCYHPIFAGTYCEEFKNGSYQWVGNEMDYAVYGDYKRHYYPIRDDGTNITAEWKSTLLPSTDYRPEARSWFKQKVGWSYAYTFASGPVGQTYIVNPSTGLVAADRVGTEACTSPYSGGAMTRPSILLLGSILALVVALLV